jgi:hypothetical protein
MRGSSPTRHPSSTRRSSPTRAQCRLPPSVSSAAPMSALTDAHLPDAAPLPDSLPALPTAFLLGGDPRPSSSAAELHSCSLYAMPLPPLAGPPVRSLAGVRVPRWPAGPRWGLVLLLSACEMLASASIFK